MRYYVIAGEASGDLHGSNLIRAMKKYDATAEFRAWGGDLMEAAGATLVKHYKELAFMGFVEVAIHLRTILRNIKQCKADLRKYQPDALILIDYPGFNLRIAEFAKKAGFTVCYYISPQVWAWKQNRVYKIRKTVDRMFCILPFEKAFYQKFDYEVDFVGHPLFDAMARFREEKFDVADFYQRNQLDPERPVIALLPGSRKQEIRAKLPLMLSVTAYYPEYQFVLAAAPSQTLDFYRKILQGKEVAMVENDTYGLLEVAKAALVTSGTATLEAALFNVPEVVCYKGNPLSYIIARKLIKVNYISLVNLIADREIVKELIQRELRPENIKRELDKVLREGKTRSELLADYRKLHATLGGPGASDKCARMIVEHIKNRCSDI